jgi:hypothetical protein
MVQSLDSLDKKAMKSMVHESVRENGLTSSS